ncbi:hypothetical protein [Mycobacterium sp. 852002-51057_SCH5723018]|uniref:hypothetical protein n=1 Tax=Mycobacterium sp. 852002-51057_SCH5723018 TaxID=1834094 RepID=UPI0007FEA775|nr:hypothetical protein [Mycobacterium sp. 852002-51057_SCH5723018]OBG28752.1 hypothetical protein A5764_24435 [Mycobacterium sp. 852002-51057_SCH5723018]
MTARLGGFFVVPFFLALTVLLAPSVSADTYTDQVVSRFDAQTHVVADSAANPPLQNPDRLNRQILTSRWTWSPAPPVWVAAVAPSQTGVTTADALHNAFLGRDPGFSGVVLVIDSKGYHVRAYNVPKVIADSVDPFMSQAARDHRNDPYGATSAFVTKLADVSVASGGPATTSPVANAKHTSGTSLWAALVIIGILLAVPGLIWFLVRRNRKRRKDADARDQVKQELIAAESDASDLANAVLNNSSIDVSAESLKANSSLYDARKAYEAGDYTAAQAHLAVVRSTAAKANRKLNPHESGGYPPRQPQPDVDAVTSVPEGERKQATVRAKDPDSGNYVTINNNNYSTTQQPGYANYYPGGYHNGVFFYPGFYPYPFWGPGWGWALTDVLLMDALLDDHWGGSYERGFEDGRDSAWADSNVADSGQSPSYDSQQGDVGFDGNYEYSGGGDTGFGGSDYSGGNDSGGGSFDFGGSDFGGGFDSGGGDSGF